MSSGSCVVTIPGLEPRANWDGSLAPTESSTRQNDKEAFCCSILHQPRVCGLCTRARSFDIWEPDTGEYYAWADLWRGTSPIVLIQRQSSIRSRTLGFQHSVSDSDVIWPKTPQRAAVREVPSDRFSRRSRRATVRTQRTVRHRMLVPPDSIVAHSQSATTSALACGEHRTRPVLPSRREFSVRVPLDWYRAATG